MSVTLSATFIPVHDPDAALGFYRRHGFDVISEIRPRPDAPPLWSMWREPQPLRSDG